jgi:hypothetical protein
LGVCVLKLSALAVVSVGLASAAFPIHAEQKLDPQLQVRVSATGVHSSVRLPDFVPVINYDQFLLASRGDEFGGNSELSPAARMAAEALSAKFATPSGGSAANSFGVAPQLDPLNPAVLDASADPKRIIQLADLSDFHELADPAKAAKPNVTAETQDAVPEKSAARQVARTPRKHIVSHTQRAKRGVSRQARNRVASSAVPARSGSTYNGIGADLQRLVGFGSLTPDHRMATR